MKFFKCEICGQIVTKIEEKPCVPNCCGQPMHEMVPGEVDGATEKHVPVVETNGDVVTVKVGEVTHPMEDAHFIQWIAVETDKGHQIKYLKPGQTPEHTFNLAGDSLVAVYEYCNLHGLWKA